jgi:threonylcarbamoyladenosine tRNA methylthiotransferase MtaB
MEIIEKFRQMIPDFNFTTDVIVGFPGESEHDFQQTVSIVKEARFSHIHTFRYSRRKGTRADRMTDQVPEKTKTERSEAIRRISEESRMEYMQSMVGKSQRVLIEKVDPHGMAHGYGEHYLPVNFETRSAATNRFQEVILQKTLHSTPPVLLAKVL